MRKELQLIDEMIAYDCGDPKRIQHFIKVYELAALIGELEGLDETCLQTLKAAALVHDIGIRYCEEQFGKCDGKLQEQYGPDLAEELLGKLSYDPDMIRRVCYLVGHHHTYQNIDGMDYQILVEADFLVNLYEDAVEKQGVYQAYRNIFRTEAGKRICRNMFGLNEV